MTRRLITNLGTNYEKAVVLNGSSQYMTSASADFDVTDVVSFGSWIKFTSAGQASATIMGNSSYKMEVTSTGNRPDFAVAGQFATTTGVAPIFKDLGWHFVVATYNKINSVIYGDAQLLVTEAHTNSLASGSGTFTVGAKSDFSGKLACQMKYAFMCNSLLTQSQVQDLYALGPTSAFATYLVALGTCKGVWSLNNTYADSSGRGNTLTATGTPTFTNVSGSTFNRGARTAL